MIGEMIPGLSGGELDLAKSQESTGDGSWQAKNVECNWLGLCGDPSQPRSKMAPGKSQPGLGFFKIGDSLGQSEHKILTRISRIS